MRVLVAVVVGYLVGAKTGGEDLDRFARSLKSLYQTDEFADVVTAARGQVGRTLRELAAVVDRPGDTPETEGDLVARVHSLVGHE